MIEWRRLRNLTAREIINALRRDGFTLFHQSGATNVTAIPTAAA
ncbi:MAG: hypothetical protein ACREFK_14155 [Stellaceae bacterium]